MSTDTETDFDPTQMEWGQPPDGHGQWRRGGSRQKKHQQFLDELQAHPRQWAIFRKDAKTGVNQDLRNYRELEVRNVPNGDGTSTVYARWVGLDENGEPDLDPDAKALRAARQQAQAERKAQKAAEDAGATEPT
jgi:hypothetical protein